MRTPREIYCEVEIAQDYPPSMVEDLLVKTNKRPNRALIPSRSEAGSLFRNPNIVYDYFGRANCNEIHTVGVPPAVIPR